MECGVEDWPLVPRVPRPATAEQWILFVGASIALAALAATIWWLVDGKWRLFRDSVGGHPGHVASIAVLIGVAVHEVIHYLLLPRSLSNRAFGICLFGAFVTAQGELSRNQCLLVLLGPLVILTGGPLMWRLVVGEPNELLVYVAIWNAGFSIMDVATAAAVATAAPRHARVHVGAGDLRFAVPDARAIQAS